MLELASRVTLWKASSCDWPLLTMTPLPAPLPAMSKLTPPKFRSLAVASPERSMVAPLTTVTVTLELLPNEPDVVGSRVPAWTRTAPLKLLLPENPLLNWPNRITEHDFDEWVEERGHSFMNSWDAQYEAPLETHDPEQSPQKGGLLVAKTGKGAYVYVAYALYRQLPEGVPGSYRLFANLLSLGKNPGVK